MVNSTFKSNALIPFYQIISAIKRIPIFHQPESKN